MTAEYIKQIAWSIHELKLLGRPDPQTQALANQTEELLDEIRRLRTLVREAASYLKEHNPKAAVQIEAQIDWTPTTPGL
jgi:hypothetical protein